MMTTEQTRLSSAVPGASQPVCHEQLCSQGAPHTLPGRRRDPWESLQLREHGHVLAARSISTRRGHPALSLGDR